MIPLFVPCLALLALSGSVFGHSSTLPVVDLGYALHQALSYNVTGGYYNFSNIRYAAPPVGQLRFAAPQPPMVNRSFVETGSAGRVCAQANPNWLSTSAEFLPAYFTGEIYNVSNPVSVSPNTSLPYDENDPRITEDCLFLDVLVPDKVFESPDVGYGAPVLVWIHGGGYIGGEKVGTFDPAGLLARSRDDSLPGLIYVAMNYRLGAFGWLAGPSLQADGMANTGLLDQEMALQWVHNNIHLFGGDKNRVTVLGESSGAGSIAHQVTAYGGARGPRPFQQAIIQSPGWIPTSSSYQSEQSYQSFLQLVNASSVQELRQLPSSTLLDANIQQVRISPYGQFVYGPVVDGIFTPAQPGQLLARGQFDHSLRLILGHNLDEGLLFTDPHSQNSSAAASLLDNFFPSASVDIIQYLIATLYPPVYNGSFPYDDPVSRMALIISDFAFTCNTKFLSRAFNNTTYNYRFAIPPGIHGTDTPYTFWSGGVSAAVQNDTIATIMQDFVVSFAKSGVPTTNATGVPRFEQNGANSTMLNLAPAGITLMRDDTANLRCEWWQKSLWA